MEIKHCPFCGHDDCRVTGVGYRGPADCYDINIVCDNCGTQGPSLMMDLDDYSSEEEIVQAEEEIVECCTKKWNTRFENPSEEGEDDND